MRVVFFCIFIFSSLFSLDKPRYPFPQNVKYHFSKNISTYPRDILVENVKNYYDRWKKDFLVCNERYCHIAFDKKDKRKTVSEGQGYGMIIVATMAGYDKDAKKIFDKLFKFAKAHPSQNIHSFMAWQVPEKKGDNDSAFDGDADIAYALLLASAQWGNSSGINYLKYAKQIINDLSKYALGKDTYLPLLGDWVEQNGKKYNQFTTRSSDFMPSHFKAFYKVTKDKRWLKAVRATQKAILKIQRYKKNKTELVSDFIQIDKFGYHPTTRHFLEEEDNSYYYNACRVPFRITLDALLNGDKISYYIASHLSRYIYKVSKANPKNIKSGYRLDGTVIGNYFSTAFVAPFGVSSKVYNQNYLNKIYTLIQNNHSNYYEDSLNLLSQLIMINAFWDPTQKLYQ